MPHDHVEPGASCARRSQWVLPGRLGRTMVLHARGKNLGHDSCRGADCFVGGIQPRRFGHRYVERTKRVVSQALPAGRYTLADLNLDWVQQKFRVMVPRVGTHDYHWCHDTTRVTLGQLLLILGRTYPAAQIYYFYRTLRIVSAKCAKTPPAHPATMLSQFKALTPLARVLPASSASSLASRRSLSKSRQRFAGWRCLTTTGKTKFPTQLFVSFTRTCSRIFPLLGSNTTSSRLCQGMVCCVDS
jgi:hypothetical protein